MSNYIFPQHVTSPKDRLSDVRVVCDSGQEGYAVAKIKWDGKEVIGMRWNGGGTSSPFPKGNPNARGKPTWFVVPAPFDQYVLMTAQLLAMRYPPVEIDEDAVVPGYCLVCDGPVDDEDESVCGNCGAHAD
jgi:hypothetical protein